MHQVSLAGRRQQSASKCTHVHTQPPTDLEAICDGDGHSLEQGGEVFVEERVPHALGKRPEVRHETGRQEAIADEGLGAALVLLELDAPARLLVAQREEQGAGRGHAGLRRREIGLQGLGDWVDGGTMACISAGHASHNYHIHSSSTQ